MYTFSSIGDSSIPKSVECTHSVYVNEGPLQKKKIVGFPYSKNPNKVPLISETPVYLLQMDARAALKRTTPAPRPRASDE